MRSSSSGRPGDFRERTAHSPTPPGPQRPALPPAPESAANADDNNAAAQPAPGWDALPQDVWLSVIQHMAVRERAGLAPLVCRAWRALALWTCDELEVELSSGKAAAGFGRWLAAHGARLTRLAVTDCFCVFSHQAADPAGRAPSRAAPWHRIALLQGLHGGGRPLPLLTDLSLQLDELTSGDAVCLGLANMPRLTRLLLNSNGSGIGITGAQGLAPLTHLRHLLVPTQGLGDQGLQIVACHLTNLEHVNLHNDGHVTDDGLPALARLTRLTSLDLQGSISITNHGMPGLAAALPQLVMLNLSWCSGVDDWGFERLCSLSCLQSLNLEATHVRLESSGSLAALPQLASLTSLNLGHSDVGPAGLAALGTSLTGLRQLWLNHSRALRSLGQLTALSSLASLTRLDVSAPAHLQQPDPHLWDVCELTQLRQLVAVGVLPGQPQLEQHRTGHLALPRPAAGRGGSSGAAAVQRQAPSRDEEGFWPAMMGRLSGMRHLTALDFRRNVGREEAGVVLAAGLVLGAAAVAPQPVLQDLRVSLTQSAEAARMSQMVAGMAQGGPRPELAGRFFDSCLLVGLGYTLLAHSGPLQERLAAACCGAEPGEGAAAGGEEEQQQQQARAARRLAALQAKVASLNAAQQAWDEAAAAAAPAAAAAAAAAPPAAPAGVELPTAPGGPKTVHDAKALIKLLLPSIRRLQLCCHDHPRGTDSWLGDGTYLWSD